MKHKQHHTHSRHVTRSHWILNWNKTEVKFVYLLCVSLFFAIALDFPWFLAPILFPPTQPPHTPNIAPHPRLLYVSLAGSWCTLWIAHVPTFRHASRQLWFFDYFSLSFSFRWIKTKPNYISNDRSIKNDITHWHIYEYCSILGMYLFGGKFCKFTDELTGQERECTCPEIINKHPHCECDRKHFNNILWATVTVFQVSNFYSTKFVFFSAFSLFV